MVASGSLAAPAWLDRTLFPFDSRYVDIDGHRVHYVDEGRGPTLLLLHGNPTWSFAYRDVIRELSSEFRCVALDYPGFGLSEAADGYGYRPAEHAGVTARFIESLDLDDVIVMLHDWGGPIGVAAAASARERIRGLVVGNTWAWPVNGDLHFEVFSRTMGGAVGRELIRRLNLFVNLTIPAGHRRRRISGHELQHYQRPMATRERRNATAVLPRAIIADRGFLESVAADLELLRDLPSLLLWADGDPAFRDRERRRWQDLLPNRIDVTIAGAGHFVQSDAPQDVADAIHAWWATVEPIAKRQRSVDTHAPIQGENA